MFSHLQYFVFFLSQNLDTHSLIIVNLFWRLLCWIEKANLICLWKLIGLVNHRKQCINLHVMSCVFLGVFQTNMLTLLASFRSISSEKTWCSIIWILPFHCFLFNLPLEATLILRKRFYMIVRKVHWNELFFNTTYFRSF